MFTKNSKNDAFSAKASSIIECTFSFYIFLISVCVLFKFSEEIVVKGLSDNHKTHVLMFIGDGVFLPLSK